VEVPVALVAGVGFKRRFDVFGSLKVADGHAEDPKVEVRGGTVPTV